MNDSTNGTNYPVSPCKIVGLCPSNALHMTTPTVAAVVEATGNVFQVRFRFSRLTIRPRPCRIAYSARQVLTSHGDVIAQANVMLDVNRTTALDSLSDLAATIGAPADAARVGQASAWPLATPAVSVDDFVARSRDLTRLVGDVLAMEAPNDTRRAHGQTVFQELRAHYDSSAPQRRADMEASVQRSMAESGEDLHKQLAQAGRAPL